jgi:DUF4097 and DUF4098 domain-containing protein YvlB
MKSSAFLLCSSLALAATASAKVTEKFAQTYPLNPAGEIHLENINGSVEIVAWDKAEVSLEAEKIAREQEGLDRMHLKIESLPGRLYVKTEMEKKWIFWDNMNAQVHYKLMVPAGVTLEKIDVVNSGIRVTGVKGPVKLASVNGSVDAGGLAGPGTFETVNGSIRVAYVSLAARPDISLKSVNGGGTLKLPADAAFELETETVNGHMSCDFPITLEKSGRHELRGTVNGGGLQVHMESVNGGLGITHAK